MAIELDIEQASHRAITRLAIELDIQLDTDRVGHRAITQLVIEQSS